MEHFKEIYNLIYKNYELSQNINIDFYFKKIAKLELTTDSFTFYNAVSAMSSSKIEGEEMDIDSFVKYKSTNTNYIASLVQKPNDLFTAYDFAQKNKLTKKNLLHAHKIVTKHLLQSSFRGKIRNSDMVIKDGKTGKIVYEACFKETIETEFNLFIAELNLLLNQNLTLQQTLFYASLLHLYLVKLHPFDDGNGRLGRLLEKWFLAEKLGQNAWFVQLELNYWNNRQNFYEYLSQVGFFYEKLNFQNAINFLLLTPQSLK